VPKRRLMITREDVERARPGGSWTSDHKLTVFLVPALIATIIAFPMVVYAPTWVSITYVTALFTTPFIWIIWVFRT